MSLFSNLFGGKKQPDIPEEKADKASELIKLIGCEYERIDPELSRAEITQLYENAYRDGLRFGYTPVIVATEDNLLEMVEINYDDNGGGTEYRSKLLAADTSGGEKLLKERCEEYISGMLEYNGEDYDIYGEFSDKATPQNEFSCVGKDDRYREGEPLLIKIPTDKPWQVFAWIPFGGWNDCPDTQDMMSMCRYWYDEYGAVPAVITSDTLQMYVPKPITDDDTALKLAEQQYGFCSDTVDQGTERIKALASSLIGSHVWFFWWD